jgi:hypothetical protein
MKGPCFAIPSVGKWRNLTRVRPTGGEERGAIYSLAEFESLRAYRDDDWPKNTTDQRQQLYMTSFRDSVQTLELTLE